MVWSDFHVDRLEPMSAFLFELLQGVAGNLGSRAIESTIESIGGRSNRHFEAVIQDAVIRGAETIAGIRPAIRPVMDRLGEWAQLSLNPESPSFPAELRRACLRGDAADAAAFLVPQLHRLRQEVLSAELLEFVGARLPQAFLASFCEALQEKKHEKGLIDFQRACLWDLASQIQQLGGSCPPEPRNEVVLSKAFLKAVHEINAEILSTVVETRNLTQTILDEQRLEGERAAGRFEETSDSMARIEEHIAALSLKQPGVRLKWTVPKPSAYFTGQDGYLEQVRASLNGGLVSGITQPAGLKGLGGIGKTEIALAYAHRHALEYEEAHFVVAESLATLETGLARIMMPNGEEEPQGEQVARLKAEAMRHLAGLGRALIVLDNVDEIVGESEFLEVLAGLGRTHVVVTCRHPSMGDRIRAVPIEKMDDDTGALYVLRLGRGDETSGPWAASDFEQAEFDDAVRLAQELDGLPLALHHAGAMMRAENLTVEEVRADYSANRERLLKNRDSFVGSTHPDSVWFTIQLAWERLQATDLAAAELVLCCAFLAPEAMFEWLFTEGKLEVREPLASALGNFSIHRAAALQSALLDRLPGDGRLAMHRVTQAVLQDLQGKDAKARCMDVGNRATYALLHLGLYRDALSQAEFIQAVVRAVATQEDHLTLTSMNNLASAYEHFGRHDEALSLFEEILGLSRRAKGELHPETLMTMSNLASVYRTMGRHQEALELDKVTLRRRQETLGDRHRDTLTSMNNLAGTYQKMGQHNEAHRLFGETLRLKHEMLGDRHPDTLTTMSNLAGSYRQLGMYAEALERCEEALCKRREVLGEQHPDTLTSINNLAATLFDLGRVGEARDLFQRVLAARMETLGHDHPLTRESRENLAEVLRRMGDERESQ